VTAAAPSIAPYDVRALRAEFPLLSRFVNGRPLAYLDNAATTQKPREVIEAIGRFFEEKNANIHRGVHRLSQEATEAYEDAREAVRRFLDAPDAREVVFLRGTTEAINLVAQSWGRANLGPGDEVLLTEMEHHSNIVPWQLVCAATGARIVVAPVDDAGELVLDELERRLSSRTKLVGVALASNALGTINPVAWIAKRAHAAGALVLVDAAQAVPHGPVSVAALGADFLAFSGHKMYGPTGVGALWARRELLEAMAPWQGGGEMIRSVAFTGSTWAEVPHKFEAGTPDIAGVVGLAAAIAFLERLGPERVAAHEAALLAYATARLEEVEGLRILGTARRKVGLVSFVIEGAHPHDVGTILDQEGVAVRTGHHCAQPLMDRFGVAATARASFAAYTTREEVDALVEGLAKVREVLC
jgi:cysteine desulfurase/selenocysteine lyase